MCGVFGVVSRMKEIDATTIAKVAFTGLFQLQHRGQESAGITVSYNADLVTHREMGTIDWVFRKRIPEEKIVDLVVNNLAMANADIASYLARWLAEQFDADKRNMKKPLNKMELTDVRSPLDDMHGDAAIAHVRYSTTGESTSRNIHPILFIFQHKQAAIAHNGNLIGLEQLKAIIQGRGGYALEGTTDTELIAVLIQTSSAPTFKEALIETLELLKGSFSLVLLYDNIVYAVNDRFAIRPLCVGENEEYALVASETCALNAFSCSSIQELAPSTLVTLSREGICVEQWCQAEQRRGCMFERVYFSRPDSLLDNKRIYLTRQAMGRELAREHPLTGIDVDIVVPVLDSGLPAAMGYAKEFEYTRGMFTHLFETALIKGRVNRTFMDPIEDQRWLLQALKHNGIPELLRGCIVVIVDDSIVRSNASKAVVRILRTFDPRMIIFLSASPQIQYSCHLGIDIPKREGLIAYDHSLEEIRAAIGADYVGYLSVEGLYRAIGKPRANFCDGCFTGEYPVAPVD
ncbi:MAG: amidophosphoribosyltransferase [Candidatus Spechtbacteria bacterium]|nr:amidophosphoribosyltransferase [Candidatus Spechtbacteria bacterium]